MSDDLKAALAIKYSAELPRWARYLVKSVTYLEKLEKLEVRERDCQSIGENEAITDEQRESDEAFEERLEREKVAEQAERCFAEVSA